MRQVAVVAPHPDDETLGCGGTLLAHAAAGDHLIWVIFTSMRSEDGFDADMVRARRGEIERVASRYGFGEVVELDYPASRLDEQDMAGMVQRFGNVVTRLEPDVLYVPSPGDAHSDHRIVFDVVSACSKWFRHPSVRRVLEYETLSETDFSLRSGASGGFLPNVFVDISVYLDEKISILGEYPSEVGDHPFPRSERSIRALADLRGAQAGFDAAEGFRLLRERRDAP